MPKTLIHQKPTERRPRIQGENKLSISEMFMDTIQGEGIHTGVPSIFVRLQGCTLACHWCDTLDVWPHGNDYSFDEIFQVWEDNDVISRLKLGHHLIWTGGSPLKQQDAIVNFTDQFFTRYKFHPFTEIENECTLMPSQRMLNIVDTWNNSPKLANSGMKEQIRIKPDVLRILGAFQLDSWFKFVISCEEDWDEIAKDFLPFIHPLRIILMPCGQTREELMKTRELTIELAIKHNVRYCDRAHITAWDKKTGV